MMNVKRLGALSLSLALTVTALTGCQSGGSASGSSSTSTPEVVEPMDISTVTDPYLATAGISGDTVVATAGDVEITADSLLYWLTSNMDQWAQYSAMFGMGEIPWDSEMEEGKTLSQLLMENSLQLSALFAILPQEAESMGVKLTEEDQKELEAAQIGLLSDFDGDETQMLHTMWGGMATPELLSQVMTVNLLNMHMEEALYGEGSSNAPTDQQLLDFAQNELGQYRTKHILLKTVDTNAPITDESGMPTGEYTPLDEATVAQQKTLAEDLLAQLQAAQDKEALFDQLMNQYSQDEGLATNPDGYVAGKGQMVAPYEEASLALNPGEISGIVESAYGYHIILRLPLNPADYRDQYIAKQMRDMQQGWLDSHPIQTNKEFEKIDPVAFYTQLEALRLGVKAEQDANKPQETPAPESSAAPESSSAASTPAQ